MGKSETLNEYFNSISQKVDWLVTTCTTSYSNPVARETAREHLNQTIRAIIEEVYEVGFVAGKKNADYNYDQKYRVEKFKIEKKLRTQLKKEIVDMVLTEYGVKDDKIKKKIIKKANEDEIDVEKDS